MISTEIQKLKENGFTYQQIADKLGVTKKRAMYWGNARERWRRKQEAYRRNAKASVARKAERLVLRENKKNNKATARANAAAERERKRAEKKLQAKLNVKARSVKRGATNRCLSYNLTQDEANKLLSSKVCERTGVEFEPKGDFAVSLDRVDNLLGYEKNNVQAVCWAYNRAKGASSDADVLRMAAGLVNTELIKRKCSIDELLTMINVVDWG